MNTTLEDFVMPQLTRSSGQVAHELGVDRNRFRYLVESGQLPGPSVSVPGRWLFNDEDVEKIRAALKKMARTPAPGGQAV